MITTKTPTNAEISAPAVELRPHWRNRAVTRPVTGTPRLEVHVSSSTIVGMSSSPPRLRCSR